MVDAIQLVNLWLYLLVLVISTYRRLYRLPWLPLYLWWLHTTVFYGVVVLHDLGYLLWINTMIWSAVIRLGLAITLMGYLIGWKK